jgi:hypothetical protein
MAGAKNVHVAVNHPVPMNTAKQENNHGYASWTPSI